jgi:hypothetical protein
MQRSEIVTIPRAAAAEGRDQGPWSVVLPVAMVLWVFLHRLLTIHEAFAL